MGDIGKRIRDLREAKGMTQDQLAKLCGYKSRASINKIELERDAPIKKLIPIANALGITPQELMGWTSDSDIAEIASVISSRDKVITEKEKELVWAYREADSLTQQMVNRLLKIEE